MQIIMTPQSEVDTFKRLEAQKYQANWAHRVSQWLLNTWVLVSIVVSIGLVNYFWYNNSLSTTAVNSLLLTGLIVYLPSGFALGPATWDVGENIELRFAAAMIKDVGAYCTFDWEIEVLSRPGGSKTLATVIWLIEHTPSGDVRRGIAMWSCKANEPKKVPSAQTKHQPA